MTASRLLRASSVPPSFVRRRGRGAVRGQASRRPATLQRLALRVLCERNITSRPSGGCAGRGGLCRRGPRLDRSTVAVGIAGAGVRLVAVDLGRRSVRRGRCPRARIGVVAADLARVGQAVVVGVRLNAGWCGSGGFRLVRQPIASVSCRRGSVRYDVPRRRRSRRRGRCTSAAEPRSSSGAATVPAVSQMLHVHWLPVFCHLEVGDRPNAAHLPLEPR